jgi:starch-binding outer membrane protein, SusD/RagB family
MKALFNSRFLIAAGVAGIMTISSCSKLEPELGAGNSIPPPAPDGAPTPPSIGAVYSQLNQFISQENYFALQEHSTDELQGPTRGTDWDDFGTWRRLHLHTWGPDHNQVNNVWNGLNGALFQSTLVAESGSGLAQAEAKFLRTYFRYAVADIYGQIQTRPATAPSKAIPAVVSRAVMIDSMITELESAVAALPAFTGANRNLATKEAAWFLLAKLYLNKAVYKAPAASPAGPFTFAPADMNKVIEYCNNIDANALLAIDNYWDNFVWDNGAKSSENIFVRKNSDGINMRWASSMGMHYFQNPGGWNGFTTLSEFYDSFEDEDTRKKANIAGHTERTGTNAGFLIGQMRGPVSPTNVNIGGVIGDPIGNLKDRAGNPLIFTRRASIFFNGEVSGIRTNKYPLDPATINDGAWGSQNEFPFFRFADVRLMKAEAILRGGSDAETPLAIVNAIRSSRGATALTALTLPVLLAERGRELYLEGWRRSDMIRFGRFNAPVEERPTASAPTAVLYPIPTIALSSNPNLKQNPGY